MSLKATLCLDDAVGERRRALLDSAGRPFRLDIERWSERGRRVLLDEIWWGRATARLPGGTGWFVDLGTETGIIATTKSPALVEGALIPVRIKSEAWSNKGPSLSLFDLPSSQQRPDRPGRHAGAPADAFLAGVEIVAQYGEADARREIDAALDEAMHPTAPLNGGGNVAIEQTRALTAIDVDAADRLGSGPAYGLELNLAAGEEAARQISLRNLGGLVVIDFLTMAGRKDRQVVVARFREDLASRLGRKSDVGEISVFGLCEASIARRHRPVSEMRGPADEREGLDVIRMIEDEGRSARGAQIRAQVSTAAAHWLENDVIGWKPALTDRIGQRWQIEPSPSPQRGPKIWSVR